MKRWSLAFTVLSLLLLVILPACGGGGSENETPTSAVTTTPALTSTPTAVSTNTPTATPTVMSTATPTPTTAEPVKIGVIMPWSGPMGASGLLTDQIIALVQDQVKDMGGILGGREIKFIRGDDRGVVAEDATQANKLILDDKVTFLILGGVSAPNFTAVADVAEELKVPYVSAATIYGVASMKYSVCPLWHDAIIDPAASFIGDVLKPKTIAYLAFDGKDSHVLLDGAEGATGLRDLLKPKGITIISEQFFPSDAQDLTPYLTKIKFLNPDLVVSFVVNMGQLVAINKQITELGGWGSMKYFSACEAGSVQSAIRIPSAVGTYSAVLWLPGSNDPGMKTFEDAFVQKYGREPTPELTIIYNPFWIAIKAIELAGTDDPEKVAQALRSGNLELDSAWGPLHIDSSGRGHTTPMVAQIQEGSKLVKVWP